MNEREALLASVCQHPDEDTPRLVFADWLQEHGDETRAEFVRVQCEIARLPDGKKMQTRQVREKELLDAHRDEWSAPLKPSFAYYYGGIYAHHYAPPVVFRRGFVETIAMDVGTFAGRGEEVFALAPVRGLRMQDAQSLDNLAGCKALLRLTELDLPGAILSEDGSGASKLFRSKNLANLTTLTARGADDNGHLDPAGLRAVANSNHLARLERLDVSDNWMFGRHADRRQAAAYLNALLAVGENKSALRELRLRSVGVEDAELLELLKQKWVRQLRVLDLSSNNVGPTGCAALCKSRALAKLDRLTLTDNQYYDAAKGEYVALPAASKRALKAAFGKRVAL
jgi:uncharacterized protein (TIGR02996 family)